MQKEEYIEKCNKIIDEKNGELSEHLNYIDSKYVLINSIESELKDLKIIIQNQQKQIEVFQEKLHRKILKRISRIIMKR